MLSPEFLYLVNILLLMISISHFIKIIRINQLLVFFVKVGVAASAGLGFILRSDDFTLIGIYASFLLIAMFLNSVETQKQCADKYNEDFNFNKYYPILLIVSLILSGVLLYLSLPNIPIIITKSYPNWILLFTAIIQFLNFCYILFINYHEFFIDQHNVLSDFNERFKFITAIVIGVIASFTVIIFNDAIVYFIGLNVIVILFGFYKILFSENLDKDHWVIITPLVYSVLLSIFVIAMGIGDFMSQLL